MKETANAIWVAVALVLAAGCGGDEPTIEQENPNYRQFLSDGRQQSPDIGPFQGQDSTTGPGQDAVSLSDTLNGLDLPFDPEDNATGGPDYLPADVGCIPGTLCYENQYKIMGSMVSIILDEQAFNPDFFLFDILPPQSKTITFTIKSNGFNQLNLVDAFLATGGNPAISMQWTTAGLPGSLPLVLQPGEAVAGTITYQPNASTPSTPSQFTVWSSDPDHLSRTVVLKPKEQGPDVELPVSAVNFGCGNYCFAQEFSIENAGNQDLVIQSTGFQNPSGEWTATVAPAPGTVLKPAGSPGYAPIPITLDYCDQDGNYTNDSNVFQIFSNDPDENPANIHLNVMLPNQCP